MGQASRPNIVLIMADDLGYECLGVNGSDQYHTPVLDQLAAEGMRFEQTFANPLCTPSRVKIMTGQYNVRNYVKFGHLDRSQSTFATLLKNNGYKTCIAGKWQLGMERDAASHFGFDEACLWQHTRYRSKKGTKYDSRYSNPHLEINGVEKEFNRGEFGPDIMTQFVCDFIKKNQREPFMVYYPMVLPHTPFVETPDSENWDPKDPGATSYKANTHRFGGMVNYIDTLVGRILKQLRELDLEDNTLVIFTGDNGTDHRIQSKWNGMTLPGGKGSLSPIGTRVPLIARLPQRIPAGSVSQELIDFSDVLPTLCEFSSTTIPKKHTIDGISFWPTLKGEQTRIKDHVYIWYEGKALARDQHHVVRRMNPKGPFQYFYSPAAYQKSKLNPTDFSPQQKIAFSKLQHIIEKNDKLRPKKLRAASEL